MDAFEAKVKCLEIASTGDSRGTLARAQEYYEWLTNEPKRPRGRPKATRSDLEGEEAFGA